MDRFLYIPGVQASGDDQLADTVDHSRPRLHAFPVESLSRPAALNGVGRVEQHARNYTGAKAVRLEEQVAVLGHMDFLDPFPFVSFIGFDQSAGYRVPTDALVRGFVENMRRASAKDDRASQAF